MWFQNKKKTEEEKKVVLKGSWKSGSLKQFITVKYEGYDFGVVVWVGGTGLRRKVVLRVH